MGRGVVERRRTGWLVAGAAAAALSCSGSPESTSGDAVSFERDLMPKFASSCGLSSSCHSLPVRDQKLQRVFLGCQASSSTCTNPSPGAVYAGLLSQSQQLPSMPYVTPGDPSNSYLQRKIDGNFAGLSCAPGADDHSAKPCGESMPPGQPASSILRAQLRAWIADGAPQN